MDHQDKIRLADDMARLRAEFAYKVLATRLPFGCRFPLLDNQFNSTTNKEILASWSPEDKEFLIQVLALWDRLEDDVSQLLRVNDTLNHLRFTEKQARQAAQAAYDQAYYSTIRPTKED